MEYYKNEYGSQNPGQNGSDKKENQDKKSLFTCGLITGVACTLVLVAAIYLIGGLSRLLVGNGAGTKGLQFSEDSAITPELVKKMQMLEDTIEKYYYLGEVTDEELDNGIYRGMLQALNDPYSEYYTSEELESLMSQTQGIYYGIGAYVGMDSETSLVKITGVIEGTPAQEADLRANDLIYAVDGTSTYGLTTTEVVALIKGEEGTVVTLTIVREGESEHLEIPVERRRVESPTVSFQMLEDGMAYIQIVEFDEVTVDQFADALATARGSGMKGLILDLRANPGGNLNAVVDIARMMLPQGMVVYTEDKYGKQTDYTCDGKRQLDVPLVVLVDMNSASASEVLAGAIKDYGIGTLVGTTTFGKGIVQQIIPFTDGSAVKVTISSYFTPNGNNIHGIGIEPDVECVFDGKTYYETEDHYDNQLEKAKAVLMEKMKSSK